MSEVRIKAKKISDLNQNASFDFETNGNETFLIVAYKPENGQPQNFKMSIKTIIDKLKNSIAMSNDEFKQQLLEVLEEYQEIRSSLETPSVLEWAQEHGFQGDDDDLWELFQSGTGGGGGESGQDTPIDTTKYIFSYASDLQEGIFIRQNGNIIGINIDNIKSLNYTQETTGIVPKDNKNGYGFCLKDYTSTYLESYTWDDRVSEGHVYIIIPAKFYNISQNVFLDESNKKYKYIDAAFKNPMVPALDPIVVNNVYEGQDYILLCFAEEGQLDKQYFKRV